MGLMGQWKIGAERERRTISLIELRCKK